jgi:hypothetical protein
MSNLLVPDPDVKALSVEVLPVVERARILVIRTQEDDEDAQRDLLKIAQVEKFVKNIYTNPKSILKQAHSAMCAEEAKWLGPLTEAKGLLWQKHSDYDQEQQRIAKQKAEALEAKALAEEEARRNEDAIRAEVSGDSAAAQEILAEPILAATVHVEAAVSKVDGVGKGRSVWSAEIVDLKALIKWVAARMDTDPGVVAYLEPATVPLNAIAKAQKSALRVDGVRAVEKIVSNVRVR